MHFASFSTVRASAALLTFQLLVLGLFSSGQALSIPITPRDTQTRSNMIQIGIETPARNFARQDGGNSATVPDTKITDFRSFGQPGCLEDNQGIWTFTRSTSEGCQRFADFEATQVKSLLMVSLIEQCNVTFYTNDDCSQDATPATVGQCYSRSAAEGDLFRGFLIECPNL